ncbi:hypothetical protein OEZ71_13445 [Defluviimonas sp. WL0050]|uniref:Uncharacterized protein n=1 Tax=Albidovulum litorale TaxID=2984134 RepID=A0ABT2ZQ64_9RHOB|nr:hypothetical protein [Defluviimonas sp. WL0050]MCV2873298.1 hypothetical protein [Defluviimonas sp. WL0050]
MISVGNLSVAQAIHERICLLYAKLEGAPEVALRLAEFDLETGWGLNHRDDRESLHRRLVDALCAYEEVTGGQVHPANGWLLEIAV